VHTVFLVHHGFRESIEVLEVDTGSQPPSVAWVGCVVAPSTAAFNSVSALPGGGFVATNPNRRTTPPPAANSTNTGEVWEWHANTGFAIVPGTDAQGPNGIEASPDGQWLFINLWPARKVMRVSRGQTPVKTDVIDVNFQPDNIRYQPDGTLLTTGHGGPSRERVIECLLKVCDDTASVVARIDPKTFAAKEIIRLPASDKFFSSTSALQVGNEIWIGTVTGDRVARHPLR
jgi:sugar lactone lactonase YvrE